MAVFIGPALHKQPQTKQMGWKIEMLKFPKS